MAALAHLSTEERVGIGVAIAAHVALAAALSLQIGRDMPIVEPPERIDVSLATDVSLDSTAPDPSDDPAASLAPTITDMPQAPTEPITAPPIEPRTAPTTVPTTAPTTRPTMRETPKPMPSPTQSAGGSVESEFAEFGRSDNRDGESGSPAATFGPSERAALSSAITRELRPHWTAPSGVDVDQLVSVVAWRLNRDGSLRGRPRCVSQRGINDSNRPQASLHCERAIRAVTLAAPFATLPDQFYSRWDDLEWEFDRRL